MSARDSNLQRKRQTPAELDAGYKNVVDELRCFLERVRSDLDREERIGVDKESLFKVFGPLLFKELNGYIAALEARARGFDEKEHELHKAYLQRSIHALALQSPFNRRCFEKPRGYPGDYMMLEMIYSEPCQGETTFAQLLNFHSMTLPIAEAVRRRCQHISEMMVEAIRENPRASFLSVGSGSAREIREILRADQGREASFHLLDQDEEALEFSRKELDGHLDSVRFINKPVIRLIREDLDMKFDFIYSQGLFDYLSEVFARRLVKRLYGLLKEKGRLVVGNASHNPSRVWMEHGSEWNLIYRDRDDLLRLAEGLDPAPEKVHVDESDGKGGMFLSLIIER